MSRINLNSQHGGRRANAGVPRTRPQPPEPPIQEVETVIEQATEVVQQEAQNVQSTIHEDFEKDVKIQRLSNDITLQILQDAKTKLTNRRLHLNDLMKLLDRTIKIRSVPVAPIMPPPPQAPRLINSNEEEDSALFG